MLKFRRHWNTGAGIRRLQTGVCRSATRPLGDNGGAGRDSRRE